MLVSMRMERTSYDDCVGNFSEILSSLVLILYELL